MPSKAQMRASHMQSNVTCLDVLSEAEAIRRECRSLIEPVEAALRISWLPIELNTALIEEVESRCGVEAAQKWIHASLLRLMKGPLLKPVVDAVSYLGMGPEHGLKRCSYGWDLIYRNCGRVECTEASVGRTTIVLRDAPSEIHAPSYHRAIASAFEGFVLGTGGHDVCSKIEEDAAVEFSIRWTA